MAVFVLAVLVCGHFGLHHGRFCLIYGRFGRGLLVCGRFGCNSNVCTDAIFRPRKFAHFFHFSPAKHLAPYSILTPQKNPLLNR